MLALGKSEKYIFAASINGKIWIISQTDLSIVREIDTGADRFELRAVLPVGNTLFVTTYKDDETKGFVLAIKDWQP